MASPVFGIIRPSNNAGSYLGDLAIAYWRLVGKWGIGKKRAASSGIHRRGIHRKETHQNPVPHFLLKRSQPHTPQPLNLDIRSFAILPISVSPKEGS